MSVKPNVPRRRQERAAKILKKGIASPGTVSRSDMINAAFALSARTQGVQKNKVSSAEKTAAASMKKRVSARTPTRRKGSTRGKK
jgi:hypothetical protein